MQPRTRAGSTTSHSRPAARRSAARHLPPPHSSHSHPQHSPLVSEVLRLQRLAGNRATTAALRTVQRTLKVGSRTVSDANLEDVWREVVPHLPSKWPARIFEQARDLFEEWAEAWGPKELLGVRLSSGVNRQYPDAEQVARALVGEMRSAENLAQETETAERLYKDPRILTHLGTLMAKLHTYVESEYADTRKRMWAKAQSTYRGAWIRWGPSRFTGGVERALRVPFGDIANNFATIRMVSLALHKGPSLKLRVNVRDAEGGFEQTSIKSEDARHNTMSLNESHPWILDARALGLPVTAGPSGTLNHLFWACDQAGASYNELLALAWAGFIFFNQDYVSMANDPHRLHEIMDVAVGYGIKYDATNYRAFLAAGPAWR